MHSIQQKILEISKTEDLWKASLRKIAELICEKCSPQKIKHHLEQLKKKGLITTDKLKWTMEKVQSWLDKAGEFFSIPILWSANCWEAVTFADWISEWYLKVSARLLWLKREKNLFALKAVWHSMNQSNIWVEKKCIEDWDYVIIDADATKIVSWDIIVSIIDSCANIKKFLEDKQNHQIVLVSESSLDFPPIYIHEEDDYIINWKVVQVIKKPRNL